MTIRPRPADQDVLMAVVALAFFAGILTVAAPCSLPVLPALLGVSLGQGDKARPVLITMGFVVAFTAAAVFFSVTTQIAGIDQTAVRTAAAVLLAAFGALMLWPRPFEWFWIRLGARLIPGDRIAIRFAQGNLGAFALGTGPMAATTASTRYRMSLSSTTRTGTRALSSSASIHQSFHSRNLWAICKPPSSATASAIRSRRTMNTPRGTPIKTNIGRRNTLSIKAVRSSSSTPARASTMKWSRW